MTVLTTEQQNTVLLRHSRKIIDYVQGHGIQNDQQRMALIALAEGWDKLSLNGEWDEALEVKLRERPDLFDFSPALKAEEKPNPAPAAIVAATQEIYKTKVRSKSLSQIDGSTCQSACIEMATDRNDIAGTRARLVDLGGPQGAGDPAVMGIILRERLGDRYVYSGKASINDMIGWLKAGEFLILHTFLTPSGHVIASDGVKDVVGVADFFDIRDPWSEFDATSFSYNNPNVNFYDGFYSARLIYASAVVAYTFEQAVSAYQSGAFDPDQPGAWCHRILPAKK